MAIDTYTLLLEQGYPLSLHLDDDRLLQAVGLPTAGAARAQIARGQFGLRYRRVGRRYIVTLRDLALWLDGGDDSPTAPAQTSTPVSSLAPVPTETSARRRPGRPRLSANLGLGGLLK